MCLRTLENLSDNRLHPGDLSGNLVSRDGVVAAADLGDESVAAIQHILHSGRRRSLGCGGWLLFGFLLALLKLPAALLIVAVGFVAGNQAGFLPIQMPLQEQSGVDHLPHLPADELSAFADAPRQLFQRAMCVLSQNPPVNLETAQPLQLVNTAAEQPDAAAQTGQSQQRGEGNSTISGYQQAGDQKRQKGRKHTKGENSPAGCLENACGGLVTGAAVEPGDILG